ncbi:2Fe-2S iron-sulfur cluster binding domain-containing protein [Quadrisphaera granulorum]|uniref:2Fe-2S iron-sulfur cluster protein n=1 Tax=Quadrisphaera granulorum TaxID=317664 RepID=A0A315ZVB4_9ACTN|nr:(2Fe-2S)-binding protein [Quadrisphaera granulorum]PWJ49546.1 2Fe-2S iron-sulfur cluster protein [Quadrisphaera granulorum]SZE98125.1 2Fe-2S iron-sulfur cluster binding domain-containing protein [Quadrisphaera granulorum]
MSARAADPSRDPSRPGPTTPVTITVDGEPVTGVLGQSLAGVVMASGRTAWRTTAAGRAPRGLFCGIGVCFDCLVTVDGVRDVRACQRRAVEGAVVTTQAEALPTRVTSDVRAGEVDDA